MRVERHVLRKTKITNVYQEILQEKFLLRRIVSLEELKVSGG
jgi:hypothetical protein